MNDGSTLHEIFESLDHLPKPLQRQRLIEIGKNDLAMRLQLEAMLSCSSRPETSQVKQATVIAGDVIDKYQIASVLGQGGMGVVFEARQLRPIKRLVALKIVEPSASIPESLGRFADEQNALAQLNHVGIARIFDAGLSNTGIPYIAMELINGVPIVDYCRQSDLTVGDKLRIFLKVCDAVSYAHQRGVIHRDLKPTNILVNTTSDLGEPKIIDFGVAKLLQTHDTRSEIDDSSEGVFGTLAYASPEQARGIRDIDTRTDIYSLGVLLFQILSGELPKIRVSPDGNDPRQYPVPPSKQLQTSGDEAGRAKKNVRLARELSGDLDFLVLKCIEFERDKRYDTVSELASDIQRWLDDKPISSTSHSITFRTRKFVRRHRGKVAVMAVLTASLLASVVSLAFGYSRTTSALALAADERDRANDVSEFLGSLITNSSIQNKNLPVIEEIIDAAVDRLEATATVHPAARYDILSTLGDTYCRIGLYGKGQDLHKACYEYCKSRFGLKHELTRFSAGNLALAYRDNERHEDAIKIGRRLLSTEEKTLGRKHADTLRTMHNLALALKDNYEFEEAKMLYEEVLLGREDTLGPTHEATLITMSNLARLLEDLGQLDDAIRLMRTVVKRQKLAFGLQNIETIISVDILGAMLAKTGSFEEAEQLTREAFDSANNILGDHHPDSIACGHNLAKILMKTGRFNEAEELLQPLLLKIRKRSGNNHRYNIGLSLTYSKCLALNNNPDAAISELELIQDTGEAIFAGNRILSLRLLLEAAEIQYYCEQYDAFQSLLDKAGTELESLDAAPSVIALINRRKANLEQGKFEYSK